MPKEVETGGNKTAIRPFRVSFPETELTELRQRIKATRWPERETVTDATQRRPARDNSETGRVLVGRIRLAQVRGEAESPAELHNRDRRARHPFHSRPLKA
jgi:hypothetical protein